MKYYCIGIKGSGMSTLAQILSDLGNDVSGYDDARETKYTESGLIKRNIPIYYDRVNELDKDTIVTYSEAFSLEHPELIRVKELGLEIKPYNQILGEITSMFETTCVCGTHGKTTTSLLVSHILGSFTGVNYFVGDGSGYASKDNKLFVIESCEYKKHLLAYHPTNIILTNIELEHTECYNGLEDIINTFQLFVNKATGPVIMCGDDNNIRKITTSRQPLYYGFNEGNNIIAKNIELTSAGSSFDVMINNTFFGHFALPLFGRHMILNALAAIALCNIYQVPVDIIRDGLTTFKGAKRRFKESTYGDIVIIDDYAHHPTEIRVTLEAAKQKYPDKELVAIFLPNTYSRTLALLDDFVEVLNKADFTYLMDIHCDRENKADYQNVSSEMILDKLTNKHYKIDIDNVSLLLNHKNAVFCFMSCTNIYEIEESFINKLKDLAN
ncbi:MAG: UDP-N-acetylmuramate--L-alanine ligase [Bacilli bacterium]